MDDLRDNEQLLPFRLFVIVVGDDGVVLSHKVASVDGDIARRTALGVTGVVRREDRSLFSLDEAGVPDAAVRTLMQQLDLPRNLLSNVEEVSRWSAPVALYEPGEKPRSDDLVAALAFRCSGISGFVEAVNRLVASEWLQMPIRPNDLARFDRWSARFITDRSLQVTICG